RWLLSLTLQSVSGFDSYAGVGFQENAVARLQGDSTNITDYHAQIDWGDSNQRVPADLASANPSSDFLVKGSHIYAQAGYYGVVVYAQGPDGTSVSTETSDVSVSQMPSGIAGIPPNPT